MFATFRGGVHVGAYKWTAHAAIHKLPAPKQVAIALSQHIGAPCAPIISVGQRVLRYQKIGEVEKGLGCPVHSSISGTVTAIRERKAPSGATLWEVVIENDFQNEELEVYPPMRDLRFLPVAEQIALIREAGISGMGGATFPTYAKLQSAVGKVDTLIINCAECEPFITADHRLLLEHTHDFLGGVADLCRILGIKQAIIAVEDNKEDAAQRLETVLNGASFACVRLLKTKYPQGDERQLIYALTRRQIPVGKLPTDVGCAVFNAETCFAIHRALHRGIPLVERIVTVSGDCIAKPRNLLVPLGTPFADLVTYCGGFCHLPARILAGGPMMGRAQWDLQTPVTKGTNALLALSEGLIARYEPNHACIHCGRCASVCPLQLLPFDIARNAQKERWDACNALYANACVECGCCAYVCPARVPLVQYIGIAKAKLRELSQAAQLKAAMQKKADTSKTQGGESK